MRRWSTKTPAEREEEEAERLVRPSPKLKPPRHDKRRERVEPDDDPDLDARDKDLSKNFKDIGGSIGGRVFLRWAKDTKRPGAGKTKRPGGTKRPSSTPKGTKRSNPASKGTKRPSAKPKKPTSGTPKPPASTGSKPAAPPPAGFGAKPPPAPKQQTQAPKPKQSKPPSKKVLVRNKQTGWTGEVTEKTFKERPGDYEKLKPVRKPRKVPDAEDVDLDPKHLPPPPKLPHVSVPPGEGDSFAPAPPTPSPPPSKQTQQPTAQPKPTPSSKRKTLSPPPPQLTPPAPQPVPPQPATPPPAAQKPGTPQQTTPAPPDPERDYENKLTLDDLAMSDPRLKSFFKSMLDPKSDVFQLAQGNPNFPVKPLFRNWAEVPRGIQTVGDLQRVLLTPDQPPPTRQKAPAAQPTPPPAAATTPPAPAGTAAPNTPAAAPSKTPSAPPAGQQKSTPPKAPGQSQSAPAGQPDADRDYKDRLRLENMAAKEPKLKAFFDTMVDKKSEFYKLTTSKPNTPVSSYLKNVSLPPGVKTLGDLQRVLGSKPASFKPSYKPDAKSGDEELDERDIEEIDIPAPPPNAYMRAGQPRRPVSQWEVTQATREISKTFPPDLSAQILMSQPPIHPDEAKELIATYNTAHKFPAADVNVISERAARFYETDPAKVPVPKTLLYDKKQVPTDQVPEKDRARLIREHQVKTVAMSMAAHVGISKHLQKAGAPKALAEAMTSYALRSKDVGLRDPTEQQRSLKAAEKLFFDTIAKPGPTLNKTQMHKMLKLMKHPGAKLLAVSYGQAGDYQAARARFLSGGKDEINERLPTKEIARKLGQASEFLRERAKRYPEGSAAMDIGQVFRQRVMKQLETLDPQKAEEVQGLLDDQDHKAYDKARKRYLVQRAQYSRQMKKYREALAKYQRTWRGKPPKEPKRPEKPVKPSRYDLKRKSPADLQGAAADLWDGFSRTAASRFVSARVLERYFRATAGSPAPEAC